MKNDQTKKNGSTPSGGDVGLRTLVRLWLGFRWQMRWVIFRKEVLEMLWVDLREFAAALFGFLCFLIALPIFIPYRLLQWIAPILVCPFTRGDEFWAEIVRRSGYKPRFKKDDAPTEPSRCPHCGKKGCDGDHIFLA